MIDEWDYHILDSLAGHGREATFTELTKIVPMSRATLLMHLRKLEEAGYVIKSKKKRGKYMETSIYRVKDEYQIGRHPKGNFMVFTQSKKHWIASDLPETKRYINSLSKRKNLPSDFAITIRYREFVGMTLVQPSKRRPQANV